VGFRVKSDLRNHQAIVQPRLYDSLMVTQITLQVLDFCDVSPGLAALPHFQTMSFFSNPDR
jgi:hypothetical protein